MIKSRLAFSLPAPIKTELALILGTWSEVLEQVDTDWLDECYKRAMRWHKSSDPFKVTEILEVWKSVSSNGEFERWQIEQRKTLAAAACFVCENTGFARYDKEGVSIAFVDNQPGSRLARCGCGRSPK